MDFELAAFIAGSKNVLTDELVRELEEKGVQVSFFGKKSFVPAYFFLVQGIDGNDFFSKRELLRIFKFVEDYSPKTLVVLPYEITSKNRKKVESVLGFAEKVKNRNLQIVYVGEVYGRGMNFGEGTGVKKILGEAFRGKKIHLPQFDFDIYLISAKVAASELVRAVFSYGFEKKRMVLTSKITVFGLFRILQNFGNFEFERTDAFGQIMTLPCFDFFEVGLDQEEIKNIVTAAPKAGKKVVRRVLVAKKFRFSFWIKIVFTTCFIVSLPLILVFISLVSVKSGFDELGKFDVKGAELLFGISKASVFVDRQVFEFADTIYGWDNLGESFVKTYNDGINSPDLYFDLTDLYRQASFLETRNSALDFASLPEIAETSNNLSTVARDLPDILGGSAKMNYAVAIFDDTQLWPTGGKIDSIVLVTFENGQITSKQTFAPSDLDGQLRGQVSAPFALTKYLGVNNWGIRYVNWDPDFSVTAAKLSWFLQNEIGVNVNGVIGINKKVWNEINEKNIFGLLKSKDVQVYLNDPVLEGAFDNLGWAGKIDFPACVGNCLSIPVSVTETNLGLNNINSQVTRRESLISSDVGKTVNNRLEIDFSNSSSENYRTYVRVGSLLGSGFDNVSEFINGGVAQNLKPDVVNEDGGTSAGVLVQVPANGSDKLVFSWEYTNTVYYGKSGKVLFYFRKQAGIYAYPLDVQIILPSLTISGQTRYNMVLDKDINQEIDF